MKFQSFLYSLLFLTIFFNACTPEEEGEMPTPTLPTEELCLDLTENRTLVNRNDGVDYLLTCNLEFSENFILTIEPGVVIEIENGRRIEIEGQAAISAIGTATDPIIFRGNNNAGQPSWKGILSDTSNPNNAFNHVIIEDGGAADYFFSKAANLFVKEGMISVTNCSFNNSGDLGLFLSDRSNNRSTILDFSNNRFNNNNQFGILVSIEILKDISENLNTCSFSNNGQPFIGVNADVYSSDFLSEDTHRWFAAPLPYLFADEIRVLGSSNLIIEAGAELVFSPGVYVVIGDFNGHDAPSIAINGTAENPVIMRGETPITGAWHGLRVKTDNVSNQIRHLHISHADDEDYAAAIVIRDTGTQPVTLAMNNVHIQDANCGIYFRPDIVDANLSEISFTNVVSEMCE